MKGSENPKTTSSLVLGCIVLCAGCIGYVFSKNWLFLVGGVIGANLIFVLKE